MDQKEILNIYKEILKNKRKVFPRNFWMQEDAKDKSIILFKYIIEKKLKMDQNSITTKFNYEIIRKYKLTTPYRNIYNKSIISIIKSVYPELQHLKALPVKKETCKKLSKAIKNLSKEKRDRINKGIREKRYNEQYAKKLSDTKLGEKNPSHKLKANQVREIRKLWSTGQYSAASLGESFGVKRQTINDIIHNRTWKHIK